MQKPGGRARPSHFAQRLPPLQAPPYLLSPSSSLVRLAYPAPESRPLSDHSTRPAPVLGSRAPKSSNAANGWCGGGTAGGSIDRAWRVPGVLAAVNARFGKRKVEGECLGLSSLAALSSLAWDYPPKAGSSTCPAWTPARPPSVRHPHSSGLALPRPRIFTAVATLLACDYPFHPAATLCLHVHLGT